jgi:hypothetical protein
MRLVFQLTGSNIMAKSAVPTPTDRDAAGSNHPSAAYRRVQGSRQMTKAWNEATIRSHAGSHGNVTGKTSNGAKRQTPP